MAGTRFVVIGGGGHAKVVIASIEAAGDVVLHVLDDDPSRWGTTLLGRPVMGPVSQELVPRDAHAVLAIGAGRVRSALAAKLSVRWGTVVHPSAVVHSSVVLGEGTVVFAGAVIQPDTTVGPHVIINTSASVDHDGNLGAYVHIAPGVHLAGQVTVGEGTLVGVGSAVIPQITIGAWSTVGAGSAVVHDVADGVTVAGRPARAVTKE
jgi:sugar O-acyltransferase (sialic acid O-acetyltransferase NeuD family)